jgi:hypothetical protein
VSEAAWPPAPKEGTLSAIGPKDRTIYFDDYVHEGEYVYVGRYGHRMRVRWDGEAPDWYLDEDHPESVEEADLSDDALNANEATPP